MPNKSWALCNLENCGAQQELLDWLTAETINAFLGGGISAEFTVSAEDADVVDVTVQVVDANGDPVTEAYSVWAWLSDTAAAAVTADPPSGGTAATTGVILQEHATDVSLDILTDATGAFVLEVTEAGTDTWFLNIRLPNGTVVSSTAITFAA